MATASSSRLGRRHKPCSICGKDHKPWWNASKGRWFLSVEKTGGGFQQVNLGDDHDKALAKWHRIEAGLEVTETSYSGPTTKGDSVLIGELAEAFLDHIEPTISKGRFRSTQFYLNRFVGKFGGDSVAKMRVGGIIRIDNWLKAQKTWSGCRPDVVSRIRQLFNWAIKVGFIPSPSPAADLAKGKHRQRLDYLTAEQVDGILKAANPYFGRGFEMLVLTGCRPEEICSLEATNVQEDKNGLYLMVDHKNQKKTNKQRRVFLVPRAAEIIREQTKLYPKGKLFRSANNTSDGIRPPLSPSYFSHAFRSLCEDTPELIALGLDDHKIVGGKRQYRYVPYTARHTFAVRYITGFYKDADGKPIELSYQILAKLMGNTAAMVEKVYGHLGEQVDFLSSKMNGQ